MNTATNEKRCLILTKVDLLLVQQIVLKVRELLSLGSAVNIKINVQHTL